MSSNKKLAFLIYVENQIELERFLQTIKKEEFPFWLNFRYDFISGQDTLKSNYIIFDLFNHRAMWGGNDLRPFGYHTPEYCSINNGVITVDSFIKISRLLFESRLPSKEYVIPVNEEIQNILRNDGYTILHRPYFGMQGSTHNLYTITPFSQSGVDAAKIGSATISQDEFLKLYIGAKTDVDSFIKENFTLTQAPTNGFLFITEDGQFIDITEKGYNYSSLIDELEKQNYNVDIDKRRIRNLEQKGYIYCDTNFVDEVHYYPYLKVFQLPTPKQFEALKLWIKSLPLKTKVDIYLYPYSYPTIKFIPKDAPLNKIFNLIRNHFRD